MIRIFNRIKQSEKIESSSRKFTKYLPYALGEIVLITVGLVLALQFNDWNDSRISYHASTDYLLELEGELLRNLDRLHYLKRGGYADNFEQTLSKLDSIGPMILGKGTEIELLSSLLYTAYAGSKSWTLQRNVYEEGVTTGELSRLDTQPTLKQTLYSDESNRALDNKLYAATSTSLKYHIHFYYRWLKFREDFMSRTGESVRSAKQNCATGLYAMYAEYNLLVNHALKGDQNLFWDNESSILSFLENHSWVGDSKSVEYKNCLALYDALHWDQGARLHCQMEFIELTENLLKMVKHEITLRT